MLLRAENGGQAVAREVRPDVVVLDLVMPAIEGRGVDSQNSVEATYLGPVSHAKRC
jgi:DNA-binding NarL/FixJ family response regulator